MRTIEQAAKELNSASTMVKYRKDGNPVPYIFTVIKDVAKRNNLTDKNQALLKMLEEFDAEAEKQKNNGYGHYNLALYLNQHIEKINKF